MLDGVRYEVAPRGVETREGSNLDWPLFGWPGWPNFGWSPLGWLLFGCSYFGWSPFCGLLLGWSPCCGLLLGWSPFDWSPFGWSYFGRSLFGVARLGGSNWGAFFPLPRWVGDTPPDLPWVPAVFCGVLPAGGR